MDLQTADSVTGKAFEPSCTSTAHLPFSDDRFEKVYSVHTIYFWTDLDQQLQEVRRVLKPGGRFVLGFRFDEEALEKFPVPIYTFYPDQEVLDRLIATSASRSKPTTQNPVIPLEQFGWPVTAGLGLAERVGRAIPKPIVESMLRDAFVTFRKNLLDPGTGSRLYTCEYEKEIFGK
jgi:SAM-dependent methyltransferase